MLVGWRERICGGGIGIGGGVASVGIGGGWDLVDWRGYVDEDFGGCEGGFWECFVF